jgi:uncharacterized protein YjdB
VRAGVVNAANWIRERGFSNVVVEIANEYPHSGFVHPVIRDPQGQASLIRLAKQTAPGLLVSASGYGDGAISWDVAEASDFLLIHLNTTTVADIPSRVNALKSWSKPIVCNEDERTGQLAVDAKTACVSSGCAYGLMHKAQNQLYPFHFDGAADDMVYYSALKNFTITNNGSSNIPVTGVTVSPTTASISVGATTTLTATVAPSNATNQTVRWSSSNTSVATVSSSGVVTGVAAGSATIKVTTQDGTKTATSAITVTVPTITLNNPSFETGSFSSWTTAGSPNIQSWTKRSGNYGACLTTTTDQIYQTVTRLQPNTLYTAEVWNYIDGSTGVGTLKLEVSGFGGTTVSTTNSTRLAWTRTTLQFTTGASATTAVIKVYMGAKPSGWVWVDDFLVSAGAKSALETEQPNAISDTRLAPVDIYPNPARGFVNIVLQNQDQIPVKVAITDISGRTVLSTIIENQQVDISNLSPGVYVFNVNYGNNIGHTRLVVK